MLRMKRSAWLWVLFAAAVTWPASAAEEKQPPAEKPAQKEAAKQEAERFSVPNGTPKELVEYIQKLIATPPSDSATRDKMRQAVLKAAEKILAAKPNAEEMEFAVQAKMNMLEKPNQIADFAAELKKGGHAKLARQVHGFMKQLALRNSIIGGQEQRKKAIENAVKFLEEAPPQPSDVSLAFMTGRLAEMSDDRELAANTYRSLAKVFASSKDARLAEFAKIMQGVTRRMDLVGHEMKIEGKLLDGLTFDWSKYLGKVVLVDFWASWCVPCLHEVPTLKECYDAYHAKGFEIVGISLDENLADLKECVKSRKIPWPIVIGDGKPSPTAAYYGVLAIPNMILVGKDGKVVSVEVRGDMLRGKLEKLLGPARRRSRAQKRLRQPKRAGKGG